MITIIIIIILWRLLLFVCCIIYVYIYIISIYLANFFLSSVQNCHCSLFLLARRYMEQVEPELVTEADQTSLSPQSSFAVWTSMTKPRTKDVDL